MQVNLEERVRTDTRNGPCDAVSLDPRERNLDASLLRDLRDIGCALVDFNDDGWICRGTNLPGRCLADKFRKELMDESFVGRLRQAASFCVVCSVGILSGVLVNRLSPH